MENYWENFWENYWKNLQPTRHGSNLQGADSGQWAVASGQWRVGSGEWAVASGQWQVAKDGFYSENPTAVGHYSGPLQWATAVAK